MVLKPPKLYWGEDFQKHCQNNVSWHQKGDLTFKPHNFAFKLTSKMWLDNRIDGSGSVFAAGTPHSAHLARLPKPLSVSLLSHLPSNNKVIMHWVEIKISFIAIYQMVGKWRGGVGVGRSCGEAFRRDIVLSGTSKCRYGSPLETLGETSHKPIQINALLVKGNARQTWCCNRASWEMFEEHLCKEFAGCGNKAGNNNQQPSSVYYHQRCRLGSWMAFFICT